MEEGVRQGARDLLAFLFLDIEYVNLPFALGRECSCYREADPSSCVLISYQFGKPQRVPRLRCW